MAIRDDVLVVGGGLAGATAALSAARTGASVRIVSYKKSTLRFASGFVDVLGYLPREGTAAGEGTGGTVAKETGFDPTADEVAGEGPVVDPFAALSRLPEDHPYRVVGEDAVRDGLALFDEVAGDRYRGGHTDANALLPTHAGTVKPTARYPATSAAGTASDDRDALFVGFPALTDFDAPMAAGRVAAAGVPFETDGVTVEFPLDFRDDAKITRYARALDTDEGGVRRKLAAAVAPHLDGAERVGFPAIVGDDRNEEVVADLSDRLGAAVFEVPTGPPSLPGLRLEERLYRALDEAGVRITNGTPVVDYEADGDGITAAVVDQKGQRVPHHADQFVLATGGLVGKGVTSDREGVEEPVFGCRVPHPSNRYDWFEDDAFGDHAFARFGVVPDDELRPTDARGDPEFDNLRAAGAVLGGADTAREKSASGVSLATGVVAGRSAGEAI